MCRISMILLTGVRGEQGAALAVDDLFDNWYILGERCRHHAKAGHHGVHGGNSSHHTKVGVKIWRQGRNMNETTQQFLPAGGKSNTCTATFKNVLVSNS